MGFTIFDFIYIETIFASILTIYFIFLLFRKKYLMDVKKVKPSKREFVKKHLLKYEIIIRSFLVIGIFICLFARIIPGIIDLKYYLSGNYFHMKGIVLVDRFVGKSKKSGQYLLVVKDIETNEKWNLTVSFPYDLHKDDELEIIYLPHLKFGEIQCVNKSNE